MSSLILPLTSEYTEFLRDESRRIGTADSISFPESEAEIIEIVHKIRLLRQTITLQGARTGIVAGAVPYSGHVLNLSRMKNISKPSYDKQANGCYRITVQPGVLLSEVREVLDKEGLFFPPDPTETSCSIGGMVACNASGALTFRYGSTRDWVHRLRLVLSDGDIIDIERGKTFAHRRSFSIRTENCRVIEGQLPSYIMPKTKSAAGYYVADNMDMVDLFIGMEGTLGIVTEIELKVIPKPSVIHGLTVFLPSQDAALKLVRHLRGEAIEGLTPPPISPVAIEFFDSRALDLIRKVKTEHSAFEKIPALKPHYHTAVYAEFHGKSEQTLEEATMQMMEVVVALGGSDEDTWYATTPRELEPIKAFRHAVPEAVNLLIDERKRHTPGITKLGTDMSVPDEYLEAVVELYEADLDANNLDSVKFGHIGNNHIHVNILPHTLSEYELGKSLYLSWAQKVVEWGGSVSAEHGIGKLKVPLLEIMYGKKGIEEMRALKALFDPDMILNPGNLF